MTEAKLSDTARAFLQEPRFAVLLALPFEDKLDRMTSRSQLAPFSPCSTKARQSASSAASPAPGSGAAGVASVTEAGGEPGWAGVPPLAAAGASVAPPR